MTLFPMLFRVTSLSRSEHISDGDESGCIVIAQLTVWAGESEEAFVARLFPEEPTCTLCGYVHSECRCAENGQR